ncbi:ATP synthase [Loktanella sp. 3ANDIMAR09]|uniref:FliI/YscN family ATPase n=1 Tax=Loktanella sp. 3ANDIMAR09 TaxID=1225657 RepID=UPI0006FB3BEF|nr:FliI/YscN family ATPase [Loktanella sp. 3ANDIMAR09]KQI69934.1 ATP synthase [Loktanella sp. 3ANDIMAR09]
MTDILSRMTAALHDLKAVTPVGRLSNVFGGGIRIVGLADCLRLGDRVVVMPAGEPIMAEVIRLDGVSADAVLDGEATGLAVGDRVRPVGPGRFSPGRHWIGRVVDPDGQPLDGLPLLPEVGGVRLERCPPPAHDRRPLGLRLSTGLAVFNTILPLVRGQRIGIFAGSGVGKSSLLAELARGVAADVVVIALVGERGREVRGFVEDTLGPEGMARAVIVAATSDRAPQTRRRCAASATAVAEYFRDQGLHVLLLVDSLTRFCEAHREVAVAAGEAANLRGHPPSAAGAIARLCERAGPGVGDMGDITAVYTVLVAGSDMDEPVADMVRGVLDGHVVLSRTIAERGRFPAIDVPASVSRSLPAAASRSENQLISDARERLAIYDRSETMIQAGLYQSGADPKLDAAVKCRDALETFLTIKDRRDAEAHFAQLRLAMSEKPGQ